MTANPTVVIMLIGALLGAIACIGIGVALLFGVAARR